MQSDAATALRQEYHRPPPHQHKADNHRSHAQVVSMELAGPRNFHQILTQELRSTFNSEAPALTNSVVDSFLFSSTLHFEVTSTSRRCGLRWGEHISRVIVNLVGEHGRTHGGVSFWWRFGVKSNTETFGLE